MAGLPSTVGPSASENGATTPAKKVDFSITRETGETSSTSSQSDIPRKDISTARLEDKPIGDLEGSVHLNRERPSILMKEGKYLMLCLWK